jgi:anti-sigma factor RsiW
MGWTDDMTCRELVALVTDYLEGRLPPRERERFEMHLANCAGCEIHLAQLRVTISALGRLPRETIPPGAWDDLLATFRSWRAA